MKKKIRRQFMVVTTLAIAATLFIISILCYDLFRAQVFEELKTIAHVVLYTNGNDVEAISEFVEEYSQSGRDDIHITLIDRDDNVLTDSKSDITVIEESYCVAVQIDENTLLRVSTNSTNLYRVCLKAVLLIWIVVVVLWIACMLLANVLTTNIIKPIEEMAEDIGKKDAGWSYEELQPIMETIRKQHEDILYSAQIRQEFTANVSHELKTPLTSISGYSELIEAGMTKDEDTRRFAGEIHKNANRLLSLINDTLELSKLDTLSGEMQMEPVDLYELSKTCVGMLELNAKKRGVTILVEGTKAYVNGSRQMLEEVIYNLCDNAIRYNKENGYVTVCVENRMDTVVFRVIDTGIGIPKEHQERVFERFYRVDKSRSKSTGGTGLGLAIVKHIVAIHGAELELQSEEHIGSTITVTFKKNDREEI